MGKAADYRKCPKCGKEIRVDATLCGYCWTKSSPTAATSGTIHRVEHKLSIWKRLFGSTPPLDRKKPRDSPSDREGGNEKAEVERLMEELIRIGKDVSIILSYRTGERQKLGASGFVRPPEQGKVDARARAIGKRLQVIGGHGLMVKAYERVKNELGQEAGRELSACWQGVGYWAQNSEHELINQGKAESSPMAGHASEGRKSSEGVNPGRPSIGEAISMKTPPTEVQANRQGCILFISYRRADSVDISGRLYDRLADHFGEGNVFKDVDSIPLGVDFRDHIENMVSKCSVLLVVIGSQWLGSSIINARQSRLEDPHDFVRIEVEVAFKRNIRVVPLLVQGARMPAEGSLPPSLKGLAYRQSIEIRSDPDFHRDVNRLIEGLVRAELPPGVERPAPSGRADGNRKERGSRRSP